MKKDYIGEIKTRLDAVSPSFCLNKWHFGVVDFEMEDYSLCCMSRRIPFDPNEVSADPRALLNSQYTSERRKEMLEGKKHSDCNICWKAEAQGQVSERFFESHYRRKNFESAVNSSYTDKGFIPAILELSFSSLCNFKCVYCSPQKSTSWRSEIEKFGPYQISDSEVFNPIVSKPSQNKEIYEKAFWLWWPQMKTKIHQLKMLGGEPLMQKETFNLLNSFQTEPAPQLNFSIHTNLGVSENIVKKFASSVNESRAGFGFCTVYISNEAVGNRAEYIRSGMNWNLWKRNLEIILNTEGVDSVCLNATLSCLSVPFFHEFCDFFIDLRARYPNKEILLVPNTVDYPDFLSIDKTPMALRENWQKTEKRLEFLKSEYSMPFQKILDIGKRLTVQANSDEKENMQNLKSYVFEVDRRRNLSFLDAFPEYLPYFSPQGRQWQNTVIA